jgi:hypothetical protein
MAQRLRKGRRGKRRKRRRQTREEKKQGPPGRQRNANQNYGRRPCVKTGGEHWHPLRTWRPTPCFHKRSATESYTSARRRPKLFKRLSGRGLGTCHGGGDGGGAQNTRAHTQTRTRVRVQKSLYPYVQARARGIHAIAMEAHPL